MDSRSEARVTGLSLAAIFLTCLVLAAINVPT